MYLLYSSSLSLLFLLMLPYFAYQSIRHGKYGASFRERLGRLPEALRSDDRPTLWVHAVSVGEFLAAGPLIAGLRESFASWRIVVSTTTMTGQTLARASQPGGFDGVFYFPFDWAFCARRALDHINPSLVIILETELWPNFLRECRRRQVVTVIANGRFSPRSFARYIRVSGFIRRVLEDLSLMAMQSEADADRAKRLGARCVRVCGNLKYDVPAGLADGPAPGSRNNDGSRRGSAATSSGGAGEISNGGRRAEAVQEIDRQFGLSSSAHLIVAGSTAPDEESILLRALRRVRRQPGLEDTRLLIAPRHPERFDEVANLLEQSGLRYARRTGGGSSTTPDQDEPGKPNEEAGPSSQPHPGNRNADVILLDTIGELAGIYRFADVVFVGGSLVPRGGHNVIEPAAYGRPIVVGPHTENFRQIISDFAQAEAVVQLAGSNDPAASLAHQLTRLLSDSEAARTLGARAEQLLAANRGATRCTMAAILESMP